jgi:exodeoxyribonuclease V alpha subunit
VNLLRVREHIEEAAGADGVVWPEDLAAWQSKVLASSMVGGADVEATQGAEQVVGRPFTAQAVAAGTLLLTRRMFVEQERVADALRKRAVAMDPGFDVEAGLARVFAGDTTGEAANAVRVAATSRLAVITGGPGTGKTFSIKRLLALLIEDESQERPLRIELAAPTGKAGVRMAEAMREGLSELAASERVKERLKSLVPWTLHRLLGVRPDGSTRHHAKNPLAADVVVVDEVSMVDLTMMGTLLFALGPDTRLVLLGDKDQLASVEAGSVLADLVRVVADGGELGERVVSFTRSRRFESAPDIAQVAAGLQKADAEGIAGALAVLCGRDHAPNETLNGRIAHLGSPVFPRAAAANVGDGTLIDTGPAGPAALSARQRDQLAAPYCGEVFVEGGVARLGYAALIGEVLARDGVKAEVLREPSFQRELLLALDRYRVLAVHRRGPLGVTGIERDVAERVRKHLEGKARLAMPRAGGHWLGRPLLVTQNAYDVDLMNGDVGLVLPSQSGAGLVAVFSGGGADAAPKVVSLSRLPPHEGALAMTVHKSQGSQFDRVAIVLAGRASPIQKRELIYTAITRAKVRVDWLGSEVELETALRDGVVRTSGLAELLSG